MSAHTIFTKSKGNPTISFIIVVYLRYLTSSVLHEDEILNSNLQDSGTTVLIYVFKMLEKKKN